MVKIPALTKIPTLAEAQALSNDVQGYWSLDGDLLDQSSNSAHMTDRDSYRAAWLAPDLMGASVGGFGYLPNASVGNTTPSVERRYTVDPAPAALLINTEMTISALVSVINVATNTEGTLEPGNSDDTAIVSLGPDDDKASQVRYQILYRQVGFIRVGFWVGSMFTPAADIDIGSGPVHVSATRDGSNQWRLYINAVEVALEGTSLQPGPSDGSGTVLSLGIGNNMQQLAMAGLIIWDASLSGAQIQSLYEMHKDDVPDPNEGVRSQQIGTTIDMSGDLNKYITLGAGVTNFSISNPLQGAMVQLIITPDPASSITMPGASDGLDGADVSNFSTTKQTVLSVICDDAVSPHYVYSVRPYA